MNDRLTLLPVLLLAAGSCVGIPPRSVNTVVGTGTAASCTEAALTASIGEANATSGLVTFNCGAAPATIVLGSEKILAGGVVIDGGNRIVLSGGDGTRIFRLSPGAAVELRNITLTRGRASGGGCLLAAGSSEAPAQLRLDNVTFRDCLATDFGGALAGRDAILSMAHSRFDSNGAGGGGAIHLDGGALNAESTSFLRNTAESQGGGLQIRDAQGGATFEDCYFYRNSSFGKTGTSHGGGAVALEVTAGLVIDSSFVSNSTDSDGAALFLAGSGVTITDSRFSGNLAAGDGGAIYGAPPSTVRGDRSSFWDNISASHGGAIATRDVLILTNSTLYRNSSRSGGAIRGDDGGIDLFNVTLRDNADAAFPSAGQLAWSGGRVKVQSSLIQSSDLSAVACAPQGSSHDFRFSILSDQSCPAGIGNRTGTVAALRPFGYHCSGAASERTPTTPLADASLLDTGVCGLGSPATDQRGMPRIDGSTCDPGATEFFPACDTPDFRDGFENGIPQRWSRNLP